MPVAAGRHHDQIRKRRREKNVELFFERDEDVRIEVEPRNTATFFGGEVREDCPRDICPVNVGNSSSGLIRSRSKNVVAWRIGTETKRVDHWSPTARTGAPCGRSRSFKSRQASTGGTGGPFADADVAKKPLDVEPGPRPRRPNRRTSTIGGCGGVVFSGGCVCCGGWAVNEVAARRRSPRRNRAQWTRLAEFNDHTQWN